jgi:predicted ATPase
MRRMPPLPRPSSPTPRAFDRDLIGILAAQLSQQRFVTVVGAGDTSNGTFLAAALMTDYPHGVPFIDLATLSDRYWCRPPSVPRLGSRLALLICRPALPRPWRTRRMLLVLDNCGHVIEAIATIAARDLRCAPSIRILAISHWSLPRTPETAWAQPADCKSPTRRRALTHLQL